MKIISILLFLFCSPLFAGGSKEEQVQTPERIVSLSPAVTEILFAVGAGENVVARTDFCNYPQEVNNIFSVGGFDAKAFSMETIVAQDPDLVIASVGMHDHLKEPLEALGIDVFMSNPINFETLYNEITEIATVTGNERTGKAIVSTMKSDIESIAKKINGLESKAVYWETWNDPYMSVGAQSYINEIISLAGGKNIFANLDEAYPVVSEETIIASNPQYIGLPGGPWAIPAESIYARKGWQDIEAIKNKQVIFISEDLVSRPGPRAALAVKELAEKLFADVAF